MMMRRRIRRRRIVLIVTVIEEGVCARAAWGDLPELHVNEEDLMRYHPTPRPLTTCAHTAGKQSLTQAVSGLQQDDVRQVLRPGTAAVVLALPLQYQAAHYHSACVVLAVPDYELNRAFKTAAAALNVARAVLYSRRKTGLPLSFAVCLAMYGNGVQGKGFRGCGCVH
eukprot:675209-Rhodomonas_salina.2